MQKINNPNNPVWIKVLKIISYVITAILGAVGGSAVL